MSFIAHGILLMLVWFLNDRLYAHVFESSENLLVNLESRVSLKKPLIYYLLLPVKVYFMALCILLMMYVLTHYVFYIHNS